MASMRRRIKRAVVKMKRGISPKDSIIITRAVTGMLSRHELNEVLDGVREGQMAGKLPALGYIYATLGLVPSMSPAERGRLYLRPKSTKSLARVIVGVRTVLRQKYGEKYKVKLGVDR